ncbi:GNAT family N-acetyltransferase [Halorhabdus amylolytica]|uniref:GNAT family N-acetyltransferase n=1 Tax=Halorhabdus amylolytica TaxID=2559573 RepID=UPI0010AA2CB5|nr:GNAT family N-acetyltransferase [Halorhabdus amylolytica]
MKVTIRTATSTDVPSLGILRGQAIEAACSDVYDRKQYADLVADPRGDLGTWIDDDPTTVLVAETEITPVAYAVLAEDTGEVPSIATNTDYQGEGFGSVLVDRLEERAGEIGLTELCVSAPTVAAGFFETQGFEQEGETDWHGLPARRLVKSIEQSPEN